MQRRTYILKLTLNIARFFIFQTIIISLWVIWTKKIPWTVEKTYFKKGIHFYLRGERTWLFYTDG